MTTNPKMGEHEVAVMGEATDIASVCSDSSSSDAETSTALAIDLAVPEDHTVPIIDGDSNDRDDDLQINDDHMLVEEIPYSTPDGKKHLLSTYSEHVGPPEEGMVFETWEMVETYFRSYAKQTGFGIVRGSSAYRMRNGQPTRERRSVKWMCEMAGKKDTRVRVNGRKVKLHSISKAGAKFVTRKSKKCDCQVFLYASAPKDGQWIIRKVNLEHTGHSPKPENSRNVAMFRHDAINGAERKKLLRDLEAGVKLPLIHRSMAIERNGLENMPFTERDLRNVAAKHRKLKEKEASGDANGMVNYFKKMAADNQNFFHAERVDGYDRLKDVMWVDARSRAAYEDFGDVVCFDSTYITNKFELPFANFVGVNHHGQTILLGCALLSHENTETFEWLFSTWLSCMGGKAPIGFLTDQCAAMRRAAANVMPESRHRWCLWHIMQKFKGKLGRYKNYKELKKELHAVIYESLTPDEFDDRWTAAISLYNLEENDWLAGLYEERSMWAPAFMRHMFWAGMKTTQRSESINSFFDGYVKKHTSLYQFASQYFAAMEARVQAENDADADCARNRKELVTEFAIEEEYQQLYTYAKFFEFQSECLKLVYVTMIEKNNKDDDQVDHVIRDRVWYRCKKSRKDIATKKTRDYIVTMNVKTNEAWCPCKMLECQGIMCRHLIRVFDIHKVSKLPEMFICNRWRKDIERKHTKVRVKYHDQEKTEEWKRYDNIMLEAESLVLVGSKSEQAMDAALEAIRAAVRLLNEKENCAIHSKAGDNMKSTPPSVNKKRPAVDGTSPDSVKKLCEKSNCTTPGSTPMQQSAVKNFDPPLLNTPSTHASTPGTQGSVGSSGMQQILPAIIKDPPLPKKPNHRTTDSRYKSAVELNSGKTKKGSKVKQGKNKGLDITGLESSLQTLQQHAQVFQLFIEQQTKQQAQAQAQALQQAQAEAFRQAHGGWYQYPYGDLGNGLPPLDYTPPARPAQLVLNGSFPSSTNSGSAQQSAQNVSLPPTYPSNPRPSSLVATSMVPIPASFGGIGLCEKGTNGAIGYVTGTMATTSGTMPTSTTTWAGLKDVPTISDINLGL